MKKTLIYLGCLALLAAGCNKVQHVEEPEEVFPELKFNITASYDAETRAVKRAWAEGDKIYVAFDISFQDEVAGFPTNHGYVTLTYDGSAFSEAEVSDPALTRALLNTPSGYLAAVHISGGQTPQFQFIPDDFYPQLYVTNRSSLGGCILSANAVDYWVEDNTLYANLSMTLDTKYHQDRYPVHFFLPSISEDRVSDYTLRSMKLCPDVFFSFSFMPTMAGPGAITPKAERLGNPDTNDPIRGSYYAGGIEFVALVDPEWAGIQTDYVLFITDNRGTPDDDSDDVSYHLPKNAALSGKEAIKLPGLFSGRWTRNPEIDDEDFSGDDMSITVTGFNDMVTW